MKRLLTALFLLTMVTTGLFAVGSAEYHFQIASIPAATETLTISGQNDERFESETNYNFQDIVATYNTSGELQNGNISVYNLQVLYNNNTTEVNCSVEDGVVEYSFKDITGQIKSKKPLLLLDNNISWMWQLVYDHYKKNETNEFSVFVPQLVVRDYYADNPLLELKIEKVTHVDEWENLFFKYNGKSGLLKVDQAGNLQTMILDVTYMERTR